MSVAKRSFDFFLYSNIFISLCAFSITVETYCLIHAPVNWMYVAFVFFSTLVFYDVPSLFFAKETFSENESERLHWILQNKRSLTGLLIFGSLCLAVTVFFFPLKFVFKFFPVAAIAFAYYVPQTRLRKIMGLKAGIVALVWVCVTCVYPDMIISGYDPAIFRSRQNEMLFLQNFLFLFPLCIIYNVRDIEADRKAQVQTFPGTFGIKKTIAICITLLLAFSVLVFFSSAETSVKSALLISAAASAALIFFASESRHDYYYSFWVDGMILLQAAMVCLAGLFR